ncbi:hypothetical protein LNV23_05105 [Paucibacter sp. DJ1R-11]|uniref:hypothetical protein n=1 Tax=Paucibacter sp. DJ1R-11 TaxID=2893556 RepID=UPI0021E4CAC4|nr:hypothetical protein [Paucibacter sp. DJ1R-11]MCV2362827.1 hypothetical protein [Paucibacter sp. DJ1R-11]
MNFESLLRDTTVTSAWRGSWARLWLRPDVFSAQEFLVGCAAIDERGLSDFRVITDSQKFECIYGAGTKSMFDRMLSDLRRVLARARETRSTLAAESLPFPFRIEMVGQLREQLPSEALERMLTDGTVPMADDGPKGKRPRFASRAAEDVVADIMDQVRGKAGLSANSFINEGYYGDQQHQVGVNLVTSSAAGVIASGWFASADRIQLEFLLGVNKLDTYVSVTGRDRAKSGFFFMRPTIEDGLTRAVAQEVETRLDNLEWRLKQMHVRVVVLSNAEEIASEVCDWAATID